MDIASFDRLTPSALGAYGGGWSARLRARVARRGGRSAIAELEHRGPLRLQKGLWPEGPDPLHLILLHPPGGIAGGDSLEIDLAVDPGAKVLVTTPGAGRWYSADAPATQRIRLSVGDGSSLEWLPQEVIVHDGAFADASIEIDVAPTASAIGWEITVLGREASGERFARGELRQSTRIVASDRLLFEDAGRVVGGEFDSPASMAGNHVSALIWAVAPQAIDDSLAQAVETAMIACGVEHVGASRVDSRLMLARVVDRVPQRVRAAMYAAWKVLRPALLARAAQAPRIWAT